jgi:hypothetical protein
MEWRDRIPQRTATLRLECARSAAFRKPSGPSVMERFSAAIRRRWSLNCSPDNRCARLSAAASFARCRVSHSSSCAGAGSEVSFLTIPLATWYNTSSPHSPCRSWRRCILNECSQACSRAKISCGRGSARRGALRAHRQSAGRRMISRLSHNVLAGFARDCRRGRPRPSPSPGMDFLQHPAQAFILEHSGPSDLCR